MDQAEILSQLILILRKTFENDDLKITNETTADDVDEWDSMTHLQLITELEKHFKVRFALGELQSLKNVGDMVGLINKKLASN